MKKKERILVASFQSLTIDSAAAMGQLGYKLSEELHRQKMLEAFIVSSKGKFQTKFPSRPVSPLSKYYLYLINNFGKRLAQHKSRYIQEYLYDLFCSFHINKNVTKLVVTNPYLYKTFRKAKKLGIEIYFIPGNPEDNYIADMVAEENRLYGIASDDAYTYRKRLSYYNKSIPLVDKVVAFSSVIAASYEKEGFGPKIINVRGYLKPRKIVLNTNYSIRQGGPFKVSFLAQTVLLKGLHYVLEAWKDLQHEEMELHIGGLIDRNVQKIIDDEYPDLKNIFYHGNITDVGSFFEDKSVYILPSLIDGAPVSVLEAMQSGLACIVSENCGTKDILEEGKSGWVVPIRNAEQIKRRILEAYRDQQKTIEMGKHAQRAIANYDMNNFARELAEKILADRAAKTRKAIVNAQADMC